MKRHTSYLPQFGWAVLATIVLSGAVSGCTEDEPRSPEAGEVIITEIMKNPAILADDDAEWLELYNTGDLQIVLGGCILADEGNSHEIAADFTIEPGSYLTFGRNSDPARIGFTPDYSYGETLKFSNSTDRVTLTCDDLLIDEVAYDNGESFPDEEGASLSLDSGSMSSGANDEGSNWCSAEEVFSYPNLGTPGAANPACP